MKRRICWLLAVVLLMIAAGGCILNNLFLRSFRFEQTAYIVDFDTGETVGTTRVEMDGCANLLTQSYSGTICVEDYPIGIEGLDELQVVTSVRSDSDNGYWSISYNGVGSVPAEQTGYTSVFSPYSYDLTVFGDHIVIQVISDGTLEDGCYVVCAENEDTVSAVWSEYIVMTQG